MIGEGWKRVGGGLEGGKAMADKGRKRDAKITEKANNVSSKLEKEDMINE